MNLSVIRGVIAVGTVVAAVCALPVPAGATPSPTTPVAVPAERAQATTATVQRIGALPATSHVPVAVSLRPTDQAALDAFVASVSDPHSRNYRHFLTTNQFAARFAPTQSEVDTVSNYLRASGLTVTGVSGTRQIVDATGDPAQVAAAFGTTLSRFHDTRTNRTFYANDRTVTVPAAIAGLVAAVSGMNDLPAATPGATAGIGPGMGSGPAGGHSPSDYRSIYGMPNLEAGENGAGETVGLFELDGFQQSDVDQYTKQFGLPALTPTVVPVDGGVSSSASNLEDILDIDAVDALAPNAKQLVYEAPNTDADSADLVAKMASDNRTDVFSSSWLDGEACESSTINAQHDSLAQLVAQGTSLFSASGDWGGHGCGYMGDNNTVTVDFMASDPNVTGVGGTSLVNTTGTPEAYTSESCWNESAVVTNTVNTRSGGGFSTIFAEPAYQNAVNSSGHRSVPDVAMDADFTTGALSVFHGTDGGFERVGGTSLASPLWAAYTALLAEKNGKRLGALNPTLYRIAESNQYASTFHDVTTGNNDTFSATTGYDECTGWGSMRGDALGTAILGTPTPPANDFSIAVSPASGSAAQGKSVSATVNSTVTSGNAETITLSAAGLPAGATAAFNPPSVTAGTSSTMTITVGANTPAGTSPITITGKTTDASHSANFTLTVTGNGTATVTVASPGNQVGLAGFFGPSVQIRASDSQQLPLTFTAANLPPGVTITAAGLISGTPTARGTFAVTVTATDTGGASGHTAFSYQVL